MIKFCKFCDKEHELPNTGESNGDWYWQSNKDTSSGGSHVCRVQKRQNCKNWDKTNPEKAKIKYKINRDKRRSTPKGKLRHSFSSLMSGRLSGKSNKKTFDLVPYSLNDLRVHLESRFEPWMNWDNYGKWEVDHIRPDCTFKYTSHEDQDFQDCWALNNLQPLERKENKIKNGKF